MFTHAMFEERALPRAIKEQIALVVSGINLSNYCLAAHLEILGRLGFEKSFARKLALNFESAPLDPKVMTLFQFLAKVSRQPADIERQDFDRVREAGWNDAELRRVFWSLRFMPAPTDSQPQSVSSPTFERISRNRPSKSTF